MMFVSVDGDDIGREIERCLLSCDVQAALRVSSGVEAALHLLARRLREQGFEVMFASGDSLLASGPTRPVAWLADQLVDLGTSFSGGLGESTALAHLALLNHLKL